MALLLLIFVHVRLCLSAPTRYLIGAIQKVGQINTSAVPRGIAMVSGFPLVVMIKLFDGNF